MRRENQRSRKPRRQPFVPFEHLLRLLELMSAATAHTRLRQRHQVSEDGAYDHE